MMNDQNIHRYLRGEMDADEKTRFERQLADDPLLAEGLDGIKQWMHADSRTYNELKPELDNLVDEILPVPPVPVAVKPRRYRKPAMAAVLFFGFLLTAYLLRPANDPEQLFADHFRPLSHPDMTVRGNADSGQANYAVKAYETENYKQAIYHYQQLTSQEPNEEKHRLFLGIAYLANYQPEKAVATLAEPFTVRMEFDDDRLWYLALAYLRINHFPEALNILKGLAASDTYYRDMSRKLVERLN